MGSSRLTNASTVNSSILALAQNLPIRFGGVEVQLGRLEQSSQIVALSLHGRPPLSPAASTGPPQERNSIEDLGCPRSDGGRRFAWGTVMSVEK
jgi:hypothetical protein